MIDREIQKKLKVLTAINTIHRSVGANLDLREMAKILVAELREIVDCEGCAVLLLDGQKVIILAECGFSELLGTGEFTGDMPAISHLIRTKQSICTGDILASPAASCVPAGCSMNSLICTPIIVGGEVRGIVHLDSPRPRAFDESDLGFIELLSSEISIVFERSLMYYHAVDLSVRDGLTGVYNRRRFDNDLERELGGRSRSGCPLSLIILDIDHFKEFNDFHGHPRGDQLLKQLVDLAVRNLRPGDRLYRYGGEEFAVLPTDTGPDEAVRVAERLRQAIASSRFDGAEESQPEGRLTASFGVAGRLSGPMDASKLIEAADVALYQAKRSGRNRVCLFSEGSA